MLRQVEFTVRNVIPPTANHQRKKIVHVRIKGGGTVAKLADKDELVKARDFWTQHLAPHRPARPLTGPLQLCVTIAWPYRKGEPKKNRIAGGLWHTTKPDLSNVVKTLEDRLTEEGFIADDAQVSILIPRKIWDETGWFSVRIQELASPARKEGE